MAEVLVLDQARGQKIFYIILQLQDPNENWIGQPTVNLDALLYCKDYFSLLVTKKRGERQTKRRHIIDLCLERLEQVVCSYYYRVGP